LGDLLRKIRSDRVVLGGAAFVSEGDRGRRQDRPVSSETVGTLIWLLDTNNLDRRRYTVLNRLREVRESAEFETLPDALRQKVREVLDDADL
jgi:hypothetical protein